MFGVVDWISDLFHPMKRGEVKCVDMEEQYDGVEVLHMPFVYTVRVGCRKGGYSLVTVNAHSSHVTVTYRCKCGEVIPLIGPPVWEPSPFPEGVGYTKGTLCRLECGSWGLHSVDHLTVIQNNDPSRMKK